MRLGVGMVGIRGLAGPSGRDYPMLRWGEVGEGAVRKIASSGPGLRTAPGVCNEWLGFPSPGAML